MVCTAIMIKKSLWSNLIGTHSDEEDDDLSPPVQPLADTSSNTNKRPISIASLDDQSNQSLTKRQKIVDAKPVDVPVVTSPVAVVRSDVTSSSLSRSNDTHNKSSSNKRARYEEPSITQPQISQGMSETNKSFAKRRSNQPSVDSQAVSSKIIQSNMQPTIHSTAQSTIQPTDRSVTQSIKQSVNRSNTQSITEPTGQPNVQLTDQLVKQSNKQSVNRPTVQPHVDDNSTQRSISKTKSSSDLVRPVKSVVTEPSSSINSQFSPNPNIASNSVGTQRISSQFAKNTSPSMNAPKPATHSRPPPTYAQPSLMQSIIPLSPSSPAQSSSRISGVTVQQGQLKFNNQHALPTVRAIPSPVSNPLIRLTVPVIKSSSNIPNIQPVSNNKQPLSPTASPHVSSAQPRQSPTVRPVASISSSSVPLVSRSPMSSPSQPVRPKRTARFTDDNSSKVYVQYGASPMVVLDKPEKIERKKKHKEPKVRPGDENDWKVSVNRAVLQKLKADNLDLLHSDDVQAMRIAIFKKKREENPDYLMTTQPPMSVQAGVCGPFINTVEYKERPSKHDLGKVAVQDSAIEPPGWNLPSPQSTSSPVLSDRNLQSNLSVTVPASPSSSMPSPSQSVSPVVNDTHLQTNLTVTSPKSLSSFESTSMIAEPIHALADDMLTCRDQSTSVELVSEQDESESKSPISLESSESLVSTPWSESNSLTVVVTPPLHPQSADGENPVPLDVLELSEKQNVESNTINNVVLPHVEVASPAPQLPSPLPYQPASNLISHSEQLVDGSSVKPLGSEIRQNISPILRLRPSTSPRHRGLRIMKCLADTRSKVVRPKAVPRRQELENIAKNDVKAPEAVVSTSSYASDDDSKYAPTDLPDFPADLQDIVKPICSPIPVVQSSNDKILSNQPSQLSVPSQLSLPNAVTLPFSSTSSQSSPLPSSPSSSSDHIPPLALAPPDAAIPATSMPPIEQHDSSNIKVDTDMPPLEAVDFERKRFTRTRQQDELERAAKRRFRRSNDTHQLQRALQSLGVSS